jgi:hypothetical protein
MVLASGTAPAVVAVVPTLKYAPLLVCLALVLPACAVGHIEDPGNADGPGNAQATQAALGQPIQLGANVPAVNLVNGGIAYGDWPTKGSPNQLALGRIWDMNVTWAQIEPQKPVNGLHNYVWTQLDKDMDDIVAAGMRPVYVFYGSPTWASVDGPGCKKAPGMGDTCATAPSNFDDWSAFVHAVVKRYLGKRSANDEPPAYEVWNEPNLAIYWDGTDEQLLELAKRAYQAIKAEAPGQQGLVTCCGWNRLAVAKPGTSFHKWLDAGGAKYVDTVSYHPYPYKVDNQQEWDMASVGTITQQFRSALDDRGIQKPLWATEAGILNAAGGVSRALTREEQAKYVTEMLLSLRAAAVPVVIWYRWDESHWDPSDPADTGYADSDLLGMHRVVDEAVAGAGADANAPAASTCDPAAQPAPSWKVKNGQCLPSCGALGGTLASVSPCAGQGLVDVGQAWDVAFCCAQPAKGPCDADAQKAPEWGEKDGACLPQCGKLGGTTASTKPCEQIGKQDAGIAYDVDYCCRDAAAPPPSTVCDPQAQPSPAWGEKNGQCLGSCGNIGGTSAFVTPCDQHGKQDAGAAYDVAYCCKELCDPATQPSPAWGEKNGQCLAACGNIGGTMAFVTPCAQHGMTDAGQAYDVAYCCK